VRLRFWQWVQYLWGHYISRNDDEINYYGAVLEDMAFLMLDLSPRARITTRQIVSLLQVEGTHFFNSIMLKSCMTCRQFPGTPNLNLRLHSVYKIYERGPNWNLPSTPETALESEVAPTLEVAKKLWLDHHMWW
jgi:hypothetical protein